MTQFAVFTDHKPEFRNYEAAPLKRDCVVDYVGDALNNEEKEESWVRLLLNTLLAPPRNVYFSWGTPDI